MSFSFDSTKGFPGEGPFYDPNPSLFPPPSDRDSWADGMFGLGGCDGDGDS
jgi:hypothetical protein